MKFLSSAFNYRSSASGDLKGSNNWVPERLMRAFGGGGVSSSGIRVSEQLAAQSSAVFACRRAISESIAIMPRKIYEGDDDGARKVVPHPSMKLLKREANPMMGSSRFFELQTRLAIAEGNSYAELEFSKKTGDAVAAWPLPPHKVKPRLYKPKRSSLQLVYDITLDDGRVVTLPGWKVLHMAGLGFDGLKGYPLLDFMMNAVGLDQALSDYSALFFKQGAGLTGYVSVPDGFNEEQIKNMLKHTALLNDGLENAHRIKFLYESAKFNPAAATPVDSQMQESRILQLQEIARFHRMPLHKIQETSKVTGYSSIEQFNIEFVNDTLMPWIVNWEEEINRKFFGEDEKFYVKFNANALLRGDANSRANYYRTMVFSALMKPNEARAFEELPPYDGGDEIMRPLNMSTDSTVAGESKKSLDGKQRVQD